MSTATHPGRPYVIGVIVACLLVSLSSILLSNLGNGPGQLVQQGIRLLLTIGLCFYLYQGRNWARWVAGVLFGLAGLIGLVGGVALLGQSLFALLPMLLAVIYLVCMAVLFFVPIVRAYFTQSPGASIPRA